ncbi:MAG: hypothetical protein AAF958_04215 [Planctomycetota bacterium]
MEPDRLAVRALAVINASAMQLECQATLRHADEPQASAIPASPAIEKN